MEQNHPNTMNYEPTLFSSKAAKVQRSHSSPSCSDPFDIPKKYMISIPTTNSIKNKKKKKRVAVASSISSSQLKMSASSSSNASASRFGKNLLPTWFGGSNTSNSGSNNENDTSSPTSLHSPSSLTSSSSINFDTPTINQSNELDSTFESLLDELNMKDANRQKLRQLPPERKLYLLQQNQQIKDTKTETVKKSMPTSNSSSSIFQNKKNLQQTKAIKRSETSRLLFQSSSNNRRSDMTPSHLSSHLIEDKNESELPTSTAAVSQDNNDVKTKKNHNVNNKKKNTNSNEQNNDANQPLSSTKPNLEEETTGGRLQLDRRAATYKYSRRNLATMSHRSKVGSMILEFDAMAKNKLDDDDDQQSAAWLLLDNKTLPRQQQQSKHVSVTTLFNQKPPPESITVSNSVAYQSLTRKNGTHLAQMGVGASGHHPDDRRIGRDRNSPYFYVERLRNRNLSTDALTNHLVSLCGILETGNVSWINEFLSRRHGGLISLENVCEKFISKKAKKKGYQKLNENEEACLYECIKCIRVLLNTKPGAEQVLQRSIILHHLMIGLFAGLSCISAGLTAPIIPVTSMSTTLTSQAPILIEPSPSTSLLVTTKNNHMTNNSNSDSKFCILIFDIFTFLSSQQYAYDIVLNVLSKVKGEQYRFERLIQSLYGVISPGDFECATAALSLFNAIVQTPQQMDKRNSLRKELERRGLDDLLKKLEKRKIPDDLQTQINIYMKKKKQDQEKIRDVEKTKRQSILQLQPDDMMASALKLFSNDPEVYYLVVDSISELVSVGSGQIKTNKRLVQDIWSVVHIFAKNLKSIDGSNNFHFALQQFIISVQPIVGKLNVADSSDSNTEDVTGKEEDDVEGLRNMVEELKDNMQKNQDVTAKIRREKNELLMKVSKALADIKERDDLISNMEKEKKTLEENMKTLTQNMPFSPAVTPTTSDTTSAFGAPPPAPPPPPPPPPPPAPGSLQQSSSTPLNSLSPIVSPSPVASTTTDGMSPVIKRRNLVRRDSHRSSKYLHPLAINLSFPTLKSLHENAVAPTSPPAATTIANTSRIATELFCEPVMKQFFWQKLPCEKISNTVWSQLTSKEEQLDTDELERLFKKNTTVVKKEQPLKRNNVTLLEFNRANNIAIMLAKIKLPFHEIRDAIWNIDDNVLSVENLMAVRQYIPAKEEIEIVKEYQGDIELLGSAERYFRSIMYIPRLADRVSCMIFRRRFKIELEEILPELDTIQMAMTELKESEKFKHVLKTVLDIGNHLNGKTIRGNAFGFHLDALLKMRDTRAEGEGAVPTLLHYLVYFLSKSEDDVVNFKHEICHLQSAARLSPPTIFASVKSLSANLNQIKEELALNRRRKTSDLQIDRFAEAMEEFLIEAEPVVEDLKTMTSEIDEKLKELIIFYGEDPTVTKAEDFFGIIASFSDSFEKAQNEIHESRERALRKQRQQEMQKKRQVPLSPMVMSPAMEKNLYQPTQEEGFEQVLRELKAGLRHNTDNNAYKAKITNDNNQTKIAA